MVIGSRKLRDFKLLPKHTHNSQLGGNRWEHNVSQNSGRGFKFRYRGTTQRMTLTRFRYLSVPETAKQGVHALSLLSLKSDESNFPSHIMDDLTRASFCLAKIQGRWNLLTSSSSFSSLFLFLFCFFYFFIIFSFFCFFFCCFVLFYALGAS